MADSQGRRRNEATHDGFTSTGLGLDQQILSSSLHSSGILDGVRVLNELSVVLALSGDRGDLSSGQVRHELQDASLDLGHGGEGEGFEGQSLERVKVDIAAERVERDQVDLLLLCLLLDRGLLLDLGLAQSGSRRVVSASGQGGDELCIVSDTSRLTRCSTPDRDLRGREARRETGRVEASGAVTSDRDAMADRLTANLPRVAVDLAMDVLGIILEGGWECSEERDRGNTSLTFHYTWKSSRRPPAVDGRGYGGEFICF